MVLIYVTAGLPHSGAAEEFFIPEVSRLQARVGRLLLVPRNRRGAVSAEARTLLPWTLDEGLLSPRVLGGAVAESFARPARAWRAFRLVVCGAPLRVAVKNLAVFCKGLWLSRVARREGAAHIHCQWASTTASLALVAHVTSGVPWSLAAHRGDIVEDNLLRVKATTASFVRFISRQGAAMAAAVCGPDLAGKSVVIRFGVEVPGEPARDEDRPNTPWVVLCPANLIPVKGHSFLIRAIGILKERGVDCRLWLAGRGALRGDLERQAESAGVADRVVFLGQLPRSEVLGLYSGRQVDAVALASVDLGGGLHEGVPVSLVEAMAHGVPVVSTRTGAIPELVTDGAGVLVPPADAVALADALERVLGDEREWRRLARGGYRRVEDAFNVERSVEELVRRIEAGA